MSERRKNPQAIGGFTFTEVLVASIIVSLIAGGTMIAFLTAARMSSQQGMSSVAEASDLAQQMLESVRNKVAQDSAWLKTASLTPPSLWGGMTAGWLDDDPAMAGGGSESILAKSAERKYFVAGEDCNDDLVKGDCYAVTVRVCWDGC